MGSTLESRVIILSVLFALTGPLQSTAQQGHSSPYYYSYFKERVSLTCSPEKVAVFESPARTDGAIALTTGLAEYGITAQALTKSPIPGLWLVDIKQRTPDAEAVEGLISSLAQEEVIGFASPVFSDARGDPMIISRHLHVGFHAAVAHDRAMEILKDFNAGTIVERDWSGMAGVYRLSCNTRDGFEMLKLANRLAELPDVRFAEPDVIATSRKSLIPNDPLFGSLWGLHNTGQSGGTIDMDMDAPEAWDITPGESFIGIVIIDDGIQQDHPDINQIPGMDFTGNGTGGGPLNQCDNHGTTVAGCTSAIINNSVGVVGVAPNCTIAAAKYSISNVPCDGSGTFFISSFVNALGWAQTIGAKVTNTSTSFSPFSSVTTQYQQTRNAGLVHFASSGNGGVGSIDYPASLSTVNAVGAVNRFGNRASFSNYGSGLAFVAPGVTIGSTDRTGSDGYVSGDYLFTDGTSFSAPYAAGVAALIFSIDMALLPDDVEQIMNNTCTDRGTAGYDTFYGWGIVNAFEAVKLARAPISPPLAAPYPHDRRKNRYLSFDPNKTGNDGNDVAFKVELKALTLGSCSGNGGFCREDRGGDDCNACSVIGNPCINQPIDCAPTPPQTCMSTGQTCVNDAPNAGGSSVGKTWWLGPAQNGVHLLVSQPFRLISQDWGTEFDPVNHPGRYVVHGGDCEVVPQARYGIRAVLAASETESEELEVETTLYAPISSSWWADAVGPLKKYCGGDIRTPECTSDGDCTAPATCDLAWTLPDGAVNFDDIGAALALVAPGPTSVAPDITWVDLHGNASGTQDSQNFDPPNYVANFSDIGAIVFGFGGRPYTYYDPADCPDMGAWP